MWKTGVRCNNWYIAVNFKNHIAAFWITLIRPRIQLTIGLVVSKDCSDYNAIESSIDKTVLNLVCGLTNFCNFFMTKKSITKHENIGIIFFNLWGHALCYMILIYRKLFWCLQIGWKTKQNQKSIRQGFFVLQEDFLTLKNSFFPHFYLKLDWNWLDVKYIYFLVSFTQTIPYTQKNI